MGLFNLFSKSWNNKITLNSYLYVKVTRTTYAFYNRNDEYYIKPIDISYYVGYYNITQALGNNQVTYFDGAITITILFPDGLYTLQSYFDTIKTSMSNAGRNEANINYSYSNNDGTITIYVTPPYTFSITNYNKDLLGFNNTSTVTNSRISNKPVNFFPHKMLYVHLKQIKNCDNYFNGKKSDILARVTGTNDEFGTLVQYKFDLPYYIPLQNTTINSLELSITDESYNIIDFHSMPVFYTFEICKK